MNQNSILIHTDTSSHYILSRWVRYGDKTLGKHYWFDSDKDLWHSFTGRKNIERD